MEICKVGKGGSVVLPAKLRRRFGIKDGAIVTAKEREGGILIQLAIETYTPKRKAEFLLSNATSRADYRRARKEVQKLGSIPIPFRIGG